MTFHVPVLFTPHECATSIKLAYILLSSSWKAHSLYISAGTQVYFRLLLSFCACKKSSSQGFTCLAVQQNCMSAGCTVLAHLRFSQKSRLVDCTCILARGQTSVVAGVRRLKPFTSSQFLWHDSVSDPHLQPTRPRITRHVLL